MKEPKITVSDHAVLRYIERSYGLSLDPIREKIIKLVKGPVAVGASSHTVDDVTFCFEKGRNSSDGIVVSTVLERGMGRTKWLRDHKG